MSEDQQQLSLQSVEQHSHQQQYKTIRELNGSSNTGGRNSLPPLPHPLPHKSNIHEMPNQDFVNRLMTATPAYFYSTAVGPNNFIFSDMLRSLVSARSSENLRQFQLQQTTALAKRSRKRPWSQQQQQQCRAQFKDNEWVNVNGERSPTPLANTFQSEKPLELTTAISTNKTFEQCSHNNNNNSNRNKCCEIELDEKTKYRRNIAEAPETPPNETDKRSDPNSSSNVNNVENESQLIPIPITISQAEAKASTASTATCLPPPPSMWYPSVYPPYGIDPLHFFIDLRVSGHIFDRERERERERDRVRDRDRKKDNTTPLSNADKKETAAIDGDKTIQTSAHTKHRQGSAFTIPIPRSLDMKKCIPLTSLTQDAINLSLSATSTTITNANANLSNESSSYDLNESKENLRNTTKSTANYMLQQHLPRLYNQFNGRHSLFSETPARPIANAIQETDNKSDEDCEDDSDGRASVDNYNEIDLTPNLANNSNSNDIDNDINNNNNNNERDIDVEIIDCIKYRTDGENSRCSSTDDLSTFI